MGKPVAPPGSDGSDWCQLRAALSAGPRAAARWATTMPAFHPGARPPAGGWIASIARPLRTSSHETIELEFHISPAPSSSRPQTSVGRSGTRVPQPLSDTWIFGQPVRTFHGLGDVGDGAVAPPPNLVAEDPRVPDPARTHRPFDNDSPLCRRVSSGWEPVRSRSVPRPGGAPRAQSGRGRDADRCCSRAATASNARPFSRTEWPPAPNGSQYRSTAARPSAAVILRRRRPSVWRASFSARCLMPLSIFRSITRLPGSMSKALTSSFGNRRVGCGDAVSADQPSRAVLGHEVEAPDPVASSNRKTSECSGSRTSTWSLRAALPEWEGVADLDVLELRQHRAGAVHVEAEEVLDPVVGVGASPAAAHLHEPGPDRARRRVDRDGAGRDACRVWRAGRRRGAGARPRRASPPRSGTGAGAAAGTPRPPTPAASPTPSDDPCTRCIHDVSPRLARALPAV